MQIAKVRIARVICRDPKYMKNVCPFRIGMDVIENGEEGFIPFFRWYDDPKFTIWERDDSIEIGQ